MTNFLRKLRSIPALVVLLIVAPTAAQAITITITVTKSNCQYITVLGVEVAYDWDVDVEVEVDVLHASHLQTAALVDSAFPSPTNVVLHDLKPSLTVRELTFEEDSNVTAKVQGLYPAPVGKKWIGFETTKTYDDVHFSGRPRVTFQWTGLPAGSETQTGGVWFGSDSTIATVDDDFVLLAAPSEYVVYKGLETTELGGASAAISGGNLDISNLGSSGDDGVSISVPLGTEFYTASWQSLGTAATSATGDFLRVSATGFVNGVRDQELGFGKITDNGTLLEATADYSPVGSATVRVEVYDGTTLLGSFPGMAGVLATFANWPRGVDKLGSGSVGATKCIYFKFDAAQTVTITGQGNFNATRLALLIDSPTATLGPLDSLSLKSKNLSPIVLTASGTVAVPTLFEWGMIALTMLLAGSGFIVLRRRQRFGDPKEGIER